MIPALVVDLVSTPNQRQQLPLQLAVIEQFDLGCIEPRFKRFVQFAGGLRTNNVADATIAEIPAKGLAAVGIPANSRDAPLVEHGRKLLDGVLTAWRG
jgi:hypothetical protein